MVDADLAERARAVVLDSMGSDVAPAMASHWFLAAARRGRLLEDVLWLVAVLQTRQLDSVGVLYGLARILTHGEIQHRAQVFEALRQCGEREELRENTGFLELMTFAASLAGPSVP